MDSRREAGGGGALVEAGAVGVLVGGVVVAVGVGLVVDVAGLSAGDVAGVVAPLQLHFLRQDHVTAQLLQVTGAVTPAFHCIDHGI